MTDDKRPPTVAIEVVGSNITEVFQNDEFKEDWKHHLDIQSNELIRRKDVIEMVEDFSVFDLIKDHLDLGGDPMITWNNIDRTVKEELKQKLKSEAGKGD